jgi:glycolate oxidase
MLKPEVIAELKRIVGRESVLTAKEDLVAYSYDATATWVHLPEAVIFPTTTKQVSQALKLANENKIPVTPRGGGTNLSGGSVPIKGGIVLCTTRMNRILEINKTNLSATVEPGVVLQDFNNALAKEGLFYPPDPQSFLSCTIGGTVAENAGGPSCAKYGITKQYVLGLEVVLASGYVMNLGGITPKNRTGFELTALFIGSEGMLGVITKIMLRLLPMPPTQKSMLAVFDDMVAAGEAVSNIMSSGVIPHKIEFVDDWVIKRFEQLMPMGLPTDANALLLLQASGSPETVETEVKQITEICHRSGAREVRLAEKQEEADKIWKARSGAMAAIFSATKTTLIEDVAVPRDKIAAFIQKCQEISKKYDVAIPLVGHAADGNIHPNILTDQSNPEHFERAKKAMDELFATALALGGVISGEHGIGLEKKHFLDKAMDPMALELMKHIKKFLDPNGILNPGKMWLE